MDRADFWGSISHGDGGDGRRGDAGKKDLRPRQPGGRWSHLPRQENGEGADLGMAEGEQLKQDTNTLLPEPRFPGTELLPSCVRGLSFDCCKLRLPWGAEPASEPREQAGTWAPCEPLNTRGHRATSLNSPLRLSRPPFPCLGLESQAGSRGPPSLMPSERGRAQGSGPPPRLGQGHPDPGLGVTRRPGLGCYSCEAGSGSLSSPAEPGAKVVAGLSPAKGHRPDLHSGPSTSHSPGERLAG